MMSLIVEQTWPLPEVDTVFNLHFRLDLDPECELLWVDVECIRETPETQRVWLSSVGPTAISLAFSSGDNLTGEMKVTRNRDLQIPSVSVYATLRYDRFGSRPEQNFQGFVLHQASPHSPHPPGPPPCPTPPPWIAPCEPEEDSPQPIVTAQLDELFPYLYVRQWPKIAAEDLEYGFFGYAASSPPSGSFYADLAAAVPRGRAAMEGLAVDFIDGAAPYSGQFIANRSALPWPVSAFAGIALDLRPMEPWGDVWIEELRDEVAQLLADGGKTGSYLRDPEYLRMLDEVWQSYFALVVTLGYDEALLGDFARTLWLANAIERALIVAHNGALFPRPLSPEQSAALAGASVLLAAPVFPLPPANPLVQPSGGSVEPYAVGDLQMVRQRLLRYSAGEIARIENVMRGERKEVSSRQGRQRLDVQEKRSGDLQAFESEEGDERVSLLEEVSRTVAGKAVTDAYDGFTTSYGPPTQATLNGQRVRTTKAGEAGGDDVTRYARTILGRTVNRISRKVESVRASSTLSHVEDKVVSVIDNSRGGGNLSAVYRWVNKIYEARVVNYGNRLIMEFVVPRPAAGYLARHCHGRGRHADAVPVPPAQMGYHTFRDVTAKTYPTVCAYYGVTDISPPPFPRTVSAALRAGDETQISIPAGYDAEIAFAGFVSASASPAPAILVGSQAVAANGEPTGLIPAGERTALPVSVADMPAAGSPPVPADGLVNIEINCMPTERSLVEWQIGIYGAVVQAYEQKVERWLAAAAEGAVPTPRRPPLAWREIERHTLKRECERLLLERTALMTGEAGSSPPSSPPAAEADAPRYLQFLETRLEWQEMTYQYHDGPDGWLADRGGDGEDPQFGRFLAADRARVLVPVKPESAFAFLYFFASGMIWSGADWLVAVNPGDVDVADDLKRASRDCDTERTVGQPWEVVVPTAMQVLDGCDRGAGGADLDLPVAGAPQ